MHNLYTEAIDCLWILSFDNENKKRMVAEPNLVSTVHDIFKTEQGRVNHGCQGILWTLREEMMNSCDHKEKGKFMCFPYTSHTTHYTLHVTHHTSHTGM